ncbi:MAG: DNRLRE domain-containing protein [Verrucomicrobiota bacterium JB024]|nr:DNRLRE domain-containing protein [Verrucomicrobiota bacterium JB024]
MKSIIAIVAALVSLSSVGFGQVVIYPSQDRTISYDSSSESYALYSVNDAQIFSGAGASSTSELRGLFNFSLDGSTAEISAASSIQLSLTRSSATGTIAYYELIHITVPADSATIGTSAFDAAGVVVDTFDAAALSNNETIDFDVTSYVQDDVDAGYSYSLFRVQAVTVAGSSNNVRFYPGQGTSVPVNVDYRPQLTVIPEPRTGALLFALLVGVWAFRRGK